jgi:hypothetical protein
MTPLMRWAAAHNIPLGPDGLPDRKVCEARGYPLDHRGLPRRQEGDGPPRPCMWCETLTEKPSDVELWFDDRHVAVGPICDECFAGVLLGDPAMIVSMN